MFAIDSIDKIINISVCIDSFNSIKISGAKLKPSNSISLDLFSGGKFSIISHGTGKYGRVLGELFVKGHDTSVNELLKENGHAYEYHGEKKKVFGS